MRQIRRVIRADHVQSVIDGVLHFSPCKTFVDLLEFRFAHCWKPFLASQITGKSEAFDQCIRNSFNDQHVQERIDGTAISCWSFNSESPYMWEVYGRLQPAIILTVTDHDLLRYVKSQRGKNAHAGDVTYHWKESRVRPKKTTVTHDSEDSEGAFYYFFHKHEFYEFEQEYRAVIFGQPGAVELPLPDELVKVITLSPCAKLEPSLLKDLKKRFGDRVQESKLRWPADDQSTPSPGADESPCSEETPTTPVIIRLKERLRGLQAQDATKGWNDPKATPAEMRRILGMAKQIFEVREQLHQAICRTTKVRRPTAAVSLCKQKQLLPMSQSSTAIESARREMECWAGKMLKDDGTYVLSKCTHDANRSRQVDKIVRRAAQGSRSKRAGGSG